MPGTTVSPAGRAAAAAAQPRGGVVVGERDDVEPGGLAAAASRSAGALGAVGDRGVGVQVDPHRRPACRTPSGRHRPAARVAGHACGGGSPGSGSVSCAVAARRRRGAGREVVALVVARRRPRPTPGRAESLPNSSALTSLVEPLGVGQVGEVAQRLVLAGRLEAERAVAEQLPDERLLPGEVGDPAQRQQGDGPDDDAGGQQHPAGADDEVPHPPLGDAQRRVDQRAEPARAGPTELVSRLAGSRSSSQPPTRSTGSDLTRRARSATAQCRRVTITARPRWRAGTSRCPCAPGRSAARLGGRPGHGA